MTTTIQFLEERLAKFRAELPQLEAAFSIYDVPISEYRNKGLNLNQGAELKDAVGECKGEIVWLEELIDFLKKKKIEDAVSIENLEDWAAQDEFGYKRKYLVSINLLTERGF